MAAPVALEALRRISQQLDELDLEKLFRRSLGEESLELALGPRLHRLRQLQGIFQRYAEQVHQEYVGQVVNLLTQIGNLMRQQEARSPAEFLAQRENFLRQLDAQLEELRKFLGHFVTAAILERGLLDNEETWHEARRNMADLKRQSEETVALIRGESERAIREAREYAREIEERARHTAAKVSVAEAQAQFVAAKAELASGVKLWGWLTGISMTILVGAPFLMMRWELSSSDSWPVAIYHSLLRVMVLSGVAAFAVLSIRMLRAHLHLAERNRHRVRVANSVESFLNATFEAQQRDLILAKLVEAIVDFGDSGLIRHERDEVASPALSADGIGRILGALSSRK